MDKINAEKLYKPLFIYLCKHLKIWTKNTLLLW